MLQRNNVTKTIAVIKTALVTRVINLKKKKKQINKQKTNKQKTNYGYA